MTIEGEFVSIAERVVYSTAWGRLDPAPVQAGRRIEAGSVIGRVRQPKAVIPLVCPVSGRFVEWLALEGEPIRRGIPLAPLAEDRRQVLEGDVRVARSLDIEGLTGVELDNEMKPASVREGHRARAPRPTRNAT